MAVSNSSPLIHLTRLGKMGYARQLFESIMIPPAVKSEAIERGKSEGYAESIVLEKFEKDGWLRTMKLSSKSAHLAEQLYELVGKGEAEAIALALEMKDRLLMDDLKGRRTAELHKIETTTTLGVIFEMLVSGVLTKADYLRNVKNYGSQGWISGEILQEFIQRGEKL
jgi:predicted nucleic acid-binding protein